MKTLNLNLRQVHEYVAKTANAYWDGWDVIIFNPATSGYTSKRGSYDKNLQQWGFAKRYSPDQKGKWHIR